MSRNRIVAGRAVIVVDILDNVQKGIASIQHNLRKLSNVMNTVGDQSFRTGLLGSIFSGVAIKQFASFEDSMLFLQTKLGIFGKAVGKNKQIMDEMEKTIRNLGRTTSFTSTQVAEGAATLAQGGFSYKEVVDSLQAVLDLSRASRTEITSTAEALVRALRAFDIPTSMAGEIASQFVRATRAGTLELEDLTTALKYSQGTAASLSQSLPTMLALFAEMSNKGLVGSTAGTSTNTAMAQIVKKMEDIKEIFPDFQPIYGPSGFDFPRTLQYLVELSKGMNELDRKVLFQDVFNLRGERSATASIDIESIINLKNEIASAGIEARKAAITMDQGLGGAARIAISAIQEMALTIVQAASEPIKNFLKVVQEIANIFSALAAQNPMLATMVPFSPGILLASGLAMIGIAKGLQVIATVLGGMRGLVRQVIIPMTTGGIAGIKQLGGLAGASTTGASNLASKIAAIKMPSRTKGPSARDLSYAADAARAKAVEALAKADDMGRMAAVDRRIALGKLSNTQATLLAREKAVTKAITSGRADFAIINRHLAEMATLEERVTDLRLQRTALTAEGFMDPSAKALVPNLDKQLAAAQTRLAQLQAQKLPTQAANLATRQTALRTEQKAIRAAAAQLPAQRGVIERLYGIGIDKSQAQRLVANDLRIAATEAAKQARSAHTSRMFSAAGMARGLASAGSAATRAGGAFMGFFRALSMARKFVPSWWTILDILILFGDKIPVVSTVLSKFGAAFSAAFSEIGKIGTYAAGPMALLKASMQAFSQNEGGLGIKGVQMAFKGLVGIIRNQLSAAWDMFKAKLDNVWTIIKGVGISLFTIFESIVFSVRSIMDSAGNIFGGIFGTGNTNFGDNFINGASSIAESVAKIINSIPFIYAMVIENMSSALEKFMLRFEAVLWDVMGTIFNNQEAVNASKAISEQVGMTDRTSSRKIEDILKQWNESSQKITDGFKSTTEENTSSAEQSNKSSQSISDYMQQQAVALQEMLKNIQGQAAEDARRQAAEDARRLQEEKAQSGIYGPKGSPSSGILQITSSIAKALVSSARDIQGNIVQYGKGLEEKQVDLLEEISDNQRRGLRQQGVILPIGP